MHPIDQLAADVAAELELLAQEMEGVVKEHLSTPATVSRGLRGGKIVQHSAPGENPRLISGKLRDDIQGAVETNGLESILSVSSGMIYAPILQDKLDRLVLSDTAEVYDEVVPDRIAAVIAGR